MIMRDLLACLDAEWFKLRRRPLPWILLGCMVGFQLLTNVSFLLLASLPLTDSTAAGVVAELRQLVTPPNCLYVTLSGVNQIGALLAIILGAVVIGSEYQWGTLRLLLLRQPRRWIYLAGLLLAMTGALGLGLLITSLAGLLLGLAVSLLTGLPIDWPGLGAALIEPGFAATLLRSYATLVVCLLFGVALTVLTRSLATGLGLGLIYFVLDAILATSTLNLLRDRLLTTPGIGPLIEFASRILLGYNLMTINSLSGNHLRLTGAAAGALEPVAVPWASIALVATYAIIFLVLPFVALRRRDIPS